MKHENGPQRKPNSSIPKNPSTKIRTQSSDVAVRVRTKGVELGPRDKGLCPKSGGMQEQRMGAKPGKQGSSRNLMKVNGGVECEMKKKLEVSEGLVLGLRSEVGVLKEEVERLKTLNLELEMRNRRVEEELAAANGKVAEFNAKVLEPDPNEAQCREIRDIESLIRDRGEGLGNHGEAIKEVTSVKKKGENFNYIATDQGVEKRTVPPPPPPPPAPPLSMPQAPPPPRKISTQPSWPRRAPALLELYHSLEKRGANKEGKCSTPVASIVGEIQNRSSYLLAFFWQIKADVEQKGELITFLIQKVKEAVFKDIEDVVRFVGWLDSELSSLADERAVLKHFDWPEKKADALREAAFEYRDLKNLVNEISSYRDDFSVACEVALKKMTNLLNKAENGIQRLQKLRSTIQCYRDNKIPTEWMSDTGIVRKIKQSSANLAKLYVSRVLTELELHPEKESTQEGLIHQGVRFAYRAHQFSGGLDDETMIALEQFRQLVPMYGRGSRELLAGLAT